MAAVASETYTSTSAPIQYAAVRAFEGGIAIERYLAHSRRILARLGNWAASQFRDVGARIASPKGGFYLFLILHQLQINLSKSNPHFIRAVSPSA